MTTSSKISSWHNSWELIPASKFCPSFFVYGCLVPWVPVPLKEDRRSFHSRQSEMASVEMCRRNVHSKSNCGTKIELGKADMLRSKRKFEVGKIFLAKKKILWYSLMIGLQTHRSRIQVHGGLVQVHAGWSVTRSIALYRHCLLKSTSVCYSKGSILLFFVTRMKIGGQLRCFCDQGYRHDIAIRL